ncbi:MAG: ECF transporter S component [Firmicutes bacterium]|nr:ECF transporter S component [Bacillota bacterium]
MNRTQWITRTAVILALAIIVQLLRLPQPVTGPVVNALILLAVILVGLWSAVLIGCLTPWIALLMGIMPPMMLPLIFVIMAANVVLALVFFGIIQRPREMAYNLSINARTAAGVLVAAAAKFLVFYAALHFLIKMLFPALAGPASVMFGIIQLYTALGGGALALLLGKYLSNYLSQTSQE